MRTGPALRELDADRFRAELDVLVSIYAEAMNAPAFLLPGRRSIMERHVEHASFRAVAAFAPPRGAPPQAAAAAARPGAAARDGADGEGSPPAGQPEGQIAGFAYGFHGSDGQWWHDLVHAALRATAGPEAAEFWLADAFEVAEVHVRPDHQGQGIGGRMVPRLLDGRTERTALLSTMDAETRARRLYRRLGFADLLTGFRFPGAEPPYAVMGAALPLPASLPPAAPAAAT